jgi:hypothetical protein
LKVLAGYIISVALLCWERRHLRKNFSNHYLPIAAFYIKIPFVGLKIVLTTAFLVFFAGYEDPDAVLEWTITFLFVLYASGFLIDLLPATSKVAEDTHGKEDWTECGMHPNVLGQEKS